MKWFIGLFLILAQLACGSKDFPLPIPNAVVNSQTASIGTSPADAPSATPSISPSPSSSPSPSPHVNSVTLKWNLVTGAAHGANDVNPNYTNCARWIDSLVSCNDSVNITDDNLTQMFVLYGACTIAKISDSYYQIDCTPSCQITSAACLTPNPSGGLYTTTAVTERCKLPPYTWNDPMQVLMYSCQSWNYNNPSWESNWSGFAGVAQ